MGLDIKNTETERLVHERASLTGESPTASITEAVRERLERLRGDRDDGLAERLMDIGGDCASRLNKPFRSADHGELLYDKRGVPR